MTNVPLFCPPLSFSVQPNPCALTFDAHEAISLSSALFRRHSCKIIFFLRGGLESGTYPIASYPRKTALAFRRVLKCLADGRCLTPAVIRIDILRVNRRPATLPIFQSSTCQATTERRRILSSTLNPSGVHLSLRGDFNVSTLIHIHFPRSDHVPSQDVLPTH